MPSLWQAATALRYLPQVGRSLAYPHGCACHVPEHQQLHTPRLVLQQGVMFRRVKQPGERLRGPEGMSHPQFTSLLLVVPAWLQFPRESWGPC